MPIIAGLICAIVGTIIASIIFSAIGITGAFAWVLGVIAFIVLFFVGASSVDMR